MKRSEVVNFILNELEAIVDKRINKEEDWPLDVHAHNILSNLEAMGMKPPRQTELFDDEDVTYSEVRDYHYWDEDKK